MTLLRKDLVDRVDAQLVGLADRADRGPEPGRGGRGGRGPRGRPGGPDALNAFYLAHIDAAGRLVQEIHTSQPDPQLAVLADAGRRERSGRPFSVPAEGGDGWWRVLLVDATGELDDFGLDDVDDANGADEAFGTTATPGTKGTKGAAAQDAAAGSPDGAVPGSATGTLAIAIWTGDLEETVSRLTLITASVGGLVLLAGGGAAYVLVRSSLRPLAEVEQIAAAIAAGDLSRRVPARSPGTEVGRLALALNAMLGQIERAFGAQQASEAQARGSERRMRQFVADASHELRTPLTSIRGFAELYRQGAVTKPQDVSRVMGRVEDEASRMGELVEELLLLARLDQQRPLERQPVDLLPVAADAVHDLQAVARDRDVRLVVGATADPPVVLGDEARLRQVLANLLANARVHAPAGTRVTVTIGTSGGTATIEVADGGPGLTSEQAERVFERFYRGDSARTRASGGTGLGLSIVAAIVNAHGGQVAVRSAPGSGAVFRVELPLAQASGPGEEAGRRRPDGRPGRRLASGG